MYYFVFHRLNKYLLNKINYTEFEFKQNKLHRIWIQTEILFKQIFWIVCMWLDKYLLNKINYTEFEFEFKQNKLHSFWIQTNILFKQIFITILNSTNSSSHYSLYNFDTNSITSHFIFTVHLTTYHSHSYFVFNCIPVWIQHLNNLQKYFQTQ